MRWVAWVAVLRASYFTAKMQGCRSTTKEHIMSYRYSLSATYEQAEGDAEGDAVAMKWLP